MPDAHGRFLKGEGGRKKGIPNKATVAKRLAEAEAANKRHEGLQATEMPLDLMLRYMRDPAEDKHVRMAMAKAAAPYCHAQLQAVAHKHLNADGTPIAPTVNLTIMPPSEPKPRLTSVGPKGDDTVRSGKSALPLPDGARSGVLGRGR